MYVFHVYLYIYIYACVCALEALQQYGSGNQPHKQESNHNEKKLKVFACCKLYPVDLYKTCKVRACLQYTQTSHAAISTCRVTTPTRLQLLERRFFKIKTSHHCSCRSLLFCTQQCRRNCLGH